MDLFDSNDVLFAKFKVSNPGYDVIVPRRLCRTHGAGGHAGALDHAAIPT